MTLPAGTRLGPYEIRGLLGSGGMGEVYRGRDTKLARAVAIKVLPSELASDRRRLDRFETEARTVSALNHPNIVTVYDVGSDDGTSFIAMELVEGRTLRELLNGGPLPLKKLLPLAAQVADGLARAHAAGVVHRDLKPENLMITRDGYVKILDFGLAKLARAEFEASRNAGHPTVTRRTEAGTVLGTVGYMSPEQASGEPADFRSDQFSFGAIVYEMATGRRAFDRPTDAQTLSAIIEAEPEPLAAAAPRAPANLAWVVERCLAKDPEDRYGSTKDLARDLAAIRDQTSGASSGAGVAPPAGRRLRLSRAGLAVAGVAVASAIALAFFAGRQVQARLDRSRPPPRQTTLTFRRGFLTGARFAPDGQTIVYSAAWDGRPSNIFSTRVGSTESRSLFENAVLLAISSKGELAISIDCGPSGIACMGTLARVPLAGGAPREVQHAVTSADWSPGGGELAVAIWGRVEYPIGKVLYQNKLGFVSSLRVSPDGNLVAFVDHPRRDSERGLLSVVDRAGRKRVLSDEWTAGPILWSPSGDEVFYSRWGAREKKGADLSGHTRSVPWVPGLDDVSGAGLFLDSGAQAENYQGVVMASRPGESPERNVSWLGRSVAADISRDGEHVLLYDEVGAPGRPEQEIFTTFLQGTDGSDVIAVGEGRALALSPDKEWALVARRSPDEHLLLLPIGAGEPHRLPGAGLLYRRASFFPDGKRIVFTGADRQGDTHLGVSYVQDLPGGAPKQVGPTGFLATVVSPDGLSVAGGQGESGIFVHRVDGGGAGQKIAGSLAYDLPIQWSADGRVLYVKAQQPEPPLTIYRLDVTTGRREIWKRLAPPDMTGFLRYGPRMRGPGYAVAPDGRSYVYTYFTDQSRLVLTEVGRNWWK
jgi:eukaryotic-like serine/threonine-protein kinase